MEHGLIFNIQRYSLHDGPGIRTTVFLKGCPLDCWWCHNPESQSALPQVVVMEGRCIRCGACREACPQNLEGDCTRCGACVEACPTEARQMIGRTVTVDELLAEILKDRIFFEDSGGGVTFSGGEPLMQFPFIVSMLQRCGEGGIHTALDTCGHAPREKLLDAARLADLVLYDLKVMDDTRHIQYTGISNARILENLKTLVREHRNIWIRMPIIPGINDSESDLRDAAEFISSLKGVQQITLLAYHKTGIAKSGRLGKPYRLAEVEPPDAARMSEIVDLFRRFRLNATTFGS